MSARPTIVIVGAGKVGRALARAFGVVAVPFSRAGSASASACARLARRLAALEAGAFVFVCLPEAALAPLAPVLALAPRRVRLVSVSGSLAARDFAALGLSRMATFHPLMTFVAGAPVDVAGAPVALRPFNKTMRALAERAGAYPFAMPRDATLYHAAAMVSAAGLVATFALAASLLEKSGVKGPSARALLLPIAAQALANAAKLGPRAALSGPVARGDEATLRAHVRAIEKRSPRDLPLYRALVAVMRRAAR